jgi:hypothetical protein
MFRSSDDNQPRSARRRLIRGVFAVPAALALHSGSALAAASGLRCVKSQVASPVFPGYVGAADVYVRVQLYALSEVALDGSVVSRWFLSGATVNLATMGVRKAINAFLLPGQWREVALQLDGKVAVLEPLLYAPPSPTLSQTWGLGPIWVALRVSPQDKKGEVHIVGVVDGNEVGTSAVTGSCWTSFTGVAAG